MITDIRVPPGQADRRRNDREGTGARRIGERTALPGGSETGEVEGLQRVRIEAKRVEIADTAHQISTKQEYRDVEVETIRDEKALTDPGVSGETTGRS